MIGNEADAALARDDYYNYNFDRILSTDGTDRVVYLINGVVYKVESVAADAYDVNATEYKNYLSIKDTVSDPVRVPVTSLHAIEGDDIIAMEYIEGDAMAGCYCVDGEEHFRCMPDYVLNLVSPYIGDTGGMNVIERDGFYYIIDMAD